MARKHYYLIEENAFFQLEQTIRLLEILQVLSSEDLEHTSLKIGDIYTLALTLQTQLKPLLQAQVHSVDLAA